VKIVINGVPYSLEESVGGAHLGDLMQLKMQSKTAGSAGVSVPTINDLFRRLGDLPDGFRPVDLLDDEDFLANVIGVMFLARRKAGEKVSYQDASEIAFDDFHFEDDDDEVESAPKDEAVDEPEPLN
jgi:hypothetical protein